MGRKFFTTLIVELGGSMNTFNPIEMCSGLKVSGDKSINIDHEVVNHLVCLNVGNLLPNDAKITAKDAAKLGAAIATIGEMQTIVMSSMEELIHNMKERFLVRWVITHREKNFVKMINHMRQICSFLPLILNLCRADIFRTKDKNNRNDCLGEMSCGDRSHG